MCRLAFSIIQLYCFGHMYEPAVYHFMLFTVCSCVTDRVGENTKRRCLSANDAGRHLLRYSPKAVACPPEGMSCRAVRQTVLSADSYLQLLTSSLTKYVFYNWLINNILYLCVT